MLSPEFAGPDPAIGMPMAVLSANGNDTSVLGAYVGVCAGDACKLESEWRLGGGIWWVFRCDLGMEVGPGERRSTDGGQGQAGDGIQLRLFTIAPL